MVNPGRQKQRKRPPKKRLPRNKPPYRITLKEPPQVPFCLGCKPFNTPGIARFGIQDAVVQAVGSSLPEFDLRWFYPVTTPMRGFGYLPVLKAFGIIIKGFLQPGFTRHYNALRRSPGADLAAIGPAVEISDAFFHTDLFGNTGDTNLAFQFFPEKNKAGIRIRFQFLPLAAM